MNRRGILIAGVAGATSMSALTAFGQAWPARPVRLLLSQPAGSGVDNIARLLGEHLGRKWKQAVIIENKPGGQNVIGAQQAARAAPDGYTFYVATLAALVTNRYLFKSLPYDPMKDFAPVGMVGRVPFALYVNPASGVKSLPEFITRAKAQPGKLSVANEGPRTFGGMLARLLNARAGMEINPISYVSVSAAVTDTVGGQTEALLCDVATAAPMTKLGRLRMLAVTTARPVVGWESVPSIAETLPGFDHAGWLGIVAPTGTPDAAIVRFNRDLDEHLRDKEFVARLLAIGAVTDGAGTPEQFGAFLASEHSRWALATREIGVLPE
jgi:tripartite-type tricarboxylate transporter receptor subunit TctC